MLNIIYKFFDYLEYRKAVRNADKAHARTSERFYVVTVSDDTKKRPTLLLMNRKLLKIYKHRGYVRTLDTVRDLEEFSIYYTPYINGKSAITEEIRKKKLAEYFERCKEHRKKLKYHQDD